MIKASPSVLPFPTYLTSGQLLENSASTLSKREEHHQPYLADVDPVLADLFSQCSFSQLAEGHCSTTVSGASPLETIAVEEFKIMLLPADNTATTTASITGIASETPVENFYALTIGTVTVFGLVALVSIVALTLGRNLTWKAETTSDSRSVEFKATHQSQVIPGSQHSEFAVEPQKEAT